jgi:eukaryotic-like serine/threonine-protein kinase
MTVFLYGMIDMDNIYELKHNIETFLKTRSSKEKNKTYIDIQKNLIDIESSIKEAENLSTKEELPLVRENLILKQRNTVLSRQVDVLLKDKSDLEQQVSVMQRERPEIPSEKLITSFMDSLGSMNRELDKSPGRTNYQVNNMNVSLRTNLSLKDNAIRFQMPRPDDVIPPENLSTIEFTIQATPKEIDLSKYIEVPDVLGMMNDNAESAITDAGLKIGEVQQNDSDLPQGSVIAQLPSANSLAEPDAAVDLVISRFIYEKVPNVVGFDLESAIEIITKSGFNSGEVTKRTDASKEGTVLGQSIEPGKEAIIGSRIDLVVSINRTVKAPDVQGMKLNEAKEKFRPLNLEVGEVDTVESDEEPDTVLKQEPEAGDSILEGGSVNLYVSKKKVPAHENTVPNVVRMNISKATEVLKTEGLVVGKITNKVHVGKEGVVLSQDPKPDSPIKRKRTVNLAISISKKDTTIVSPRKLTGVSGTIPKTKK